MVRRVHALPKRIISVIDPWSTAIRGLPATYTEGREIALEIAGNLKIREAVKAATFATTLKLERNTLSGTAATAIL